MLKGILSISGKPGLFRLVSRGNKMLIVESLLDHKRQPAYGSDKIISLADIAMYTDEEEVPLKTVLESVKKNSNGEAVALNCKKASREELSAWFAEILPNYDRDRVYMNDIKKLISWYNLLLEAGITDFSDKEETETVE